MRPKFKRDRYPDEVPVQREALEKYDTGAFDFDPVFMFCICSDNLYSLGKCKNSSWKKTI